MLYPVLISAGVVGGLLLLLPDGVPFLAGAGAYGVCEMIFYSPDFLSIGLLVSLFLLAFCFRFPPPFRSLLPVVVIAFSSFYLRPNAPPSSFLYSLLFPALFSYQRKQFSERGLLWLCLLLLVGGFLLSPMLTLPSFFVYASPWLGYAFTYRRPPVWVMEITVYLSFLFLALQ